MEKKMKKSVKFTSNAVTEDSWRNNPAKRSKKGLQFALTHRFWDTTNIKVGSFDILATRTSKRNLRRKIRKK